MSGRIERTDRLIKRDLDSGSHMAILGCPQMVKDVVETRMRKGKMKMTPKRQISARRAKKHR